jgi:hypothetical protein
MRIIAVGLFFLTLGVQVNAQNYSGRYAVETEAGVAVVELNLAADGATSGTFGLNGYTMLLSGVSDGVQVSGNLVSETETLGFLAQLDGDYLVFSLFAYNVFGQPDLATAQTLQLRNAPAAGEAEGEGTDATDGAVFVNRTELAATALQDIATRYGTRIPPGRYWYDAHCGAWGVEGGPTLGFTAAGLELAGPLPSDISGRGTGIFINGREIHQQDRMALVAMFGVTYPGRYTLDSMGNLSIEGGAFLVNLVQASRSSQQSASGGGLYSGMGGTVGTDGSGGVLFYTKNASGGYNTYNN